MLPIVRVRTAALLPLLFFAQIGAASAQDLRARLTSIMEEAPGVRVRKLRISERSVTIGLELPPRVRLDDLPAVVENQLEVVAGAVAAERPSVNALHLLVAHPGEPLRPPPARPPSPSTKREPVRSVARDPSRFPFGQALLGRTVALSPGHGWLFSTALNRYATQRGNVRWNGCGTCRGITEDFETQEIVVRYLVPLLEGAGARVVLVRERGYSDQSQVVDDGDPGYTESGTYADGVSEGGHAGDYRASFDVNASAEWTVTATRSGPQLLSLWFVSGTNRHLDARLQVLTPGGTHEYLVDQTILGRRWTPIGRFDIRSGDLLTARLLAPMTAVGDRALITDAVRLGAGRHASDHPWWQMSAKEFAAYQEAPPEVQSRGDVTIRPRYAEWFGADAYVSVHSNASGAADSTAAGSSTYRYNCGAYPDHSNDPPASSCDDPTGSDRLQELVHQYLVDQLRADWDPAWIDRGTKVANFGEVRELDGIPGILIESAFHDNVRLAGGSNLRMTDNQALHDPRWRRAAAFGIYRGISEFLVGPGPLVAPPPSALAARRIDRTSVEVSFDSVPDAMGYRIYVAAGGRTFDEGRVVNATTAVIDALPEGPVAIKIASLNEAGEGTPSKVVVARSSRRPAQVLVVDAFEREDAWVQEYDNRWDTSLVYGLALAPGEYAFDGATEAALESGLVSFDDYDAVALALGRESTEHEVLTAGLRDQLASFVAGGGAVFAAGSEIAYALDDVGDADSRAFLTTVFGATFAADDAGAGAISGAAGAWLEGAASSLVQRSSAGFLETRSSDVLAPTADGVSELYYEGQTDVAAVRRDRSIVMGVALDSLADPVARTEILGAWLDNAVVLAPPDEMPPVDGGVPDPDAGEPGDAGERDTGFSFDASPKDSGSDAGFADAADEPDAAPRALAAQEPIRGGCGCRTGGGGGGRPLGGFLLLLLAVLWRWPRRSSRG